MADIYLNHYHVAQFYRHFMTVNFDEKIRTTRYHGMLSNLIIPYRNHDINTLHLIELSVIIQANSKPKA